MSVLRVLVVRGVVVAVRIVVVRTVVFARVVVVVVAKLCSHTALTHFGPNSRTAKRPIKEKTGTCPEEGEREGLVLTASHTHTPIHSLVGRGRLTVSVTRRSTEQLFCCAFSARTAFELTAFDIALTPTGDASQLVSHNNNKAKEAASDRDREGERAGDEESEAARGYTLWSNACTLRYSICGKELSLCEPAPHCLPRPSLPSAPSSPCRV